MKFKCLCSLLAISLLCGCNIENNELHESMASHTSASTTVDTIVTTTVTTPPITETTAVTEPLEPDDVIPDAVQTPRVDGNRLTFTIKNIYSDLEYYTVEISGVRLDETGEATMETTYINGELYGDFRLDLYQKGELLDSLKINVPRDDRFLILESVTQELSYGCELISNRRIYDDTEYPDLIQLDFYLQNEVEAPQYARFFSVFNGKIEEVPVYENGTKTAPYGTHMESVAAGLMVQQLVAQTANGNYTVIQYEYTFNADEHCLIRKQVKYTGRRD